MQRSPGSAESPQFAARSIHDSVEVVYHLWVQRVTGPQHRQQLMRPVEEHLHDSTHLRHLRLEMFRVGLPPFLARIASGLRVDGGLCGGVQGTIALGKNGLTGLVFVPVACTPDSSGGVLAALDAKTGKEVWSLPTASYSWSSPLDIYAADGTGRIVYCTTDGTVYLLDGLTGKILAASSLGCAI